MPRATPIWSSPGLYERLGEPRIALDAIRRRGYMSGWPRYLATAQREEGRLALATGDTGVDLNVRASLRKQLHPGYRDEVIHEYRDVTPLL
jgi:hypothetical protein